jgi:transcriptional regulator
VSELDPGRVLATVARAAEVHLDTLVGRQVDTLKTARLAAALLLREQGLSERAIARALHRTKGWVWYALATARETPAALELATKARAQMGRRPPSAEEIAAILRSHRDR